MLFSSLILLLLAAPTLFSSDSILVSALPAGFVSEFVTEVTNPIDLLFLPKPNNNAQQPLMVSDKAGRISVWLNHENSDASRIVADFRPKGVCTDGARGLMGLEHHPNFSTNANRWIYAFYTWKSGNNCINRVSRFPVDANYIFNMNAEEVLVQLPPMIEDLHLGSDMVFGNDGMLWITNGDNGALNDDAVGQRYNTLYGKLVRITPTGGIPNDNPFANDRNMQRCNRSGNAKGRNVICGEIFALGLRSPFKIVEDPNVKNKVRMAFLDVGGSLYEEINIFGTDYPDANYGWPLIEGPCNRTNGKNNRVCTPNAVIPYGFEEPLHWYDHDSEGGAIVGGAIVPNGLWPPEYDGTFLFGDYTDSRVYHLVSDPSRGCRGCPMPRTPFKMNTFFDQERVVEMKFGPYKNTQALYVLDRTRGAALKRIIFEGDTGGNSAPIAFLKDSTVGDLLPNQSIRFDASDSSDPDNDALTYRWDFGDGSTTKGTGANPRAFHSYNAVGTYNVVVTVTDAGGLSNQARIQVQVGSRPIVTLVSPPAGSTFSVDDTFDMIARAKDIDGTDLPARAFTWEIRRHHNTHFHPWLSPTTGNNLRTRAAPFPEDFLAATNSYMEILVTAENSLGLQSTATINIQPNTVLVDFTAIPAGLSVPLKVFGYVLDTPEIGAVMWENHEFEIEAPNVPGYSFVGWSDGGAQKHRVRLPSGLGRRLSYVATYEVSLVNGGGSGGGGVVGGETRILSINTGEMKRIRTDGEGNKWEKDSYFLGGFTGKSSTDIQNTDNQRIMQRRRRGYSIQEQATNGEGNLKYSIPVRDGDYKIVFYFFEVAKKKANERVFSVKVNGPIKLRDYDIYKKVGEDVATTEEVTTTAKNGKINIEFMSNIDRPEVSGIVIYSLSSAPAPTPSLPTPPSGPSPPTGSGGFVPHIFINCGSNVAYTDASNGNEWVGEKDLVKGGFAGRTGKAITGTSNPLLYQSRRRGNAIYTIPVPSPGTYKVELFFVELSKQLPGKRIFTVKIQGQDRLTKYDPLASAGFLVADMQEVIVQGVTGGSLTIELVADIDVPEISAIAVYRQTGGSPPAPTPISPSGPTPTPPSSGFSLYINAGDNRDYTDSDGNFWFSDKAVSVINGFTGRSGTKIQGTDEQRLMKRRQRGYSLKDQKTNGGGNLKYAIKVPNGNYRVVFYFVEVAKTSANKRVFSVKVNGPVKLRDYDIFKKVGKNVATTEEVTTSVLDGKLTIEFVAKIDRPEISGIAILAI